MKRNLLKLSMTILILLGFIAVSCQAPIGTDSFEENSSKEHTDPVNECEKEGESTEENQKTYLEKFTIFALENVKIADRVDVLKKGVGANNYIEVGCDSNVDGQLTNGCNIFLRERAHITGDVTSAGIVLKQNHVTIDGTVKEKSPYKTLEISQKNFTTGDESYTVYPGRSLTLEPGSYECVRVFSCASLTLKPGQYYFYRLEMGCNSKLIANLTESDLLNINVEKFMCFGDRSKVKIPSSADAGQVRFYTNQERAFRIGTDCLFYGVVEAPFADTIVYSRTDVYGALFAKNVIIEPDVVINGEFDEKPPSSYYYKCALDILVNGASHGSDYYIIDPDGKEGPIVPFEVWCDMDTDGGGWTEITLEAAKKYLSAVMTAVDSAAINGIDGAYRPYTQDDEGSHTYHYTIPLPFGYKEFYLNEYNARANACKALEGHNSDIVPFYFYQVIWEEANDHVSVGDISFGTSEERGPVASYARELYSCWRGVDELLPWPAKTQIYALGGQSYDFRIGWGEYGPHYEGWYPWYSGTIRVR